MQSGARTPYYANGTDMNLDYFGLRSPTGYTNFAGTPSSSYEDPLAQYGSNAVIPQPDVLLDGYKIPPSESHMDTHERPHTPRKPRGSALLDANDPVAMHLLVETAIGDSQEYEVLSFEELEALKKEHSNLVSRIEGTRRKLMLESKVRDAALSLNRLYSKKSKAADRPSPKHRRSFRGSHGSNESIKKDAALRSEDELAASSKRCDELSRELYQLEVRSKQAQTKLLKHTAGVLQMTHSGPAKGGQGLQGSNGTTNGIMPDSPVSVYTYETGRARVVSIGPDKFDERSLYRSPDQLDGIVEKDIRPTPRWAQRLSRVTSIGSRRASLSNEVQSQTIASVVQRLATFNDRLHEFLVQANSERDQPYPAAPRFDLESYLAQGTVNLDEQLDYLDQGLNKVISDQSSLWQQKHIEHDIEGRLQEINNSIYNIINGSYTFEGGDYPRPPQTQGEDPDRQLNYAEEGMFNLQQIHQSLLEAAEQSRSRLEDDQEKSAQYETVLAGLWQILLANEEEARHWRLQDAQNGFNDEKLPDDHTDVNEEFSIQAFSDKVQQLCNRAATLQDQQASLHQQLLDHRSSHIKSTTEKDAQLTSLHSQLSQAQEEHSTTKLALDHANSQLSDHQDTSLQQSAHLTSLTAELSQSRANHAAAERQLSDLQAQLAQLQQHASAHADALHTERNAFRQREGDLLAELQARQDQVENLEAYIAGAVQEERESRREVEERLVKELEQRNSEAAGLREEVGEAREEGRRAVEEWEGRVEGMGEQVRRVEGELEELRRARDEVEERLRERESAAKSAEVARRELESEVVTLRTEITVARAELDAAYGSRAERAAELAASADRDVKARMEELAASNTALLAELEELRRLQQDAVQRETQLKDELAGLLPEFEELTRMSVEAERDRERMEGVVDGLRERCEGLEGLVSDEKIQMIGRQGLCTPTGETTSTMVLKSEFKKMMREARVENLRMLRAEQEERRKLEALVRTLRKEQMAGKSSLSQRTAAVG